MIRWLVAALAFGLSAPGALAGPQVKTAPSLEAIDASRSDQLAVHALAGVSAILIFDFPSLAQQGEMFNRMVALAERGKAPRDRVLPPDELAALISSLGKTPSTFSMGNDFPVGELTRFFNLARQGRMDLNGQEAALRDFLVENGLASRKDDVLQAVEPEGVVLSIPQAQPMGERDGVPVGAALRSTILRHEMGHGEYYANREYAEYCRRFWADVMTEAERNAFTGFLGRKHYDDNNRELMINETQAYLIHTPDPAAFNAGMVGLPPAAVQGLRDAFWAGKPPTTLSRSNPFR